MRTPLLFAAEDNILILVFAIAVFVGGIFLTRAIFSIPRIIRTLRAQAYLLGEIAEKQGVAPTDIVTALQHIDHPNVKLEIQARAK